VSQNPPEVHTHERTLYVELMYPNCGDNVDTVQLGMCHVRAADDIRLSYDFDRDGWSIKQQKYTEIDGIGAEGSDEWREVAFVKSWALSKPGA
jgi:hypothetical protein